MQNYNNLSPKMTHQNAFVLTRQPIHHIYNMVLLTRGDAYALPRADCSDYQPENTEQSLKHSTNLHRTLHVPPITPMLSIQKSTKTAEDLNETAKTDPKTA